MARIKNMKNAKKVENPGVLLKRLMGYIMKHYGAAFVTVLICILISVICNVQGTMFMQTLIDDYIVPMLKDGSRDFSGLAHAITRVAGFYAIGVAVTLLYSQIMVNITQGTLRSLRDDLFTHMQDLPIKYFDTHAHGDIMSVYTNDIDTLRQMISQSIPQIFNSGIMVVSIIVCMLVLSVPLTVVSLAMVGIMVYLSKRIATLSGKYFVQQQKDLGAANGYIEEMMQGQKVVKVFCHEEKSIEEFKELNDKYYFIIKKFTKYVNDYIDATSESSRVKSSHITHSGRQKLDGVQAVSYTRVRYTAGGDYKRTERMRTVVEAMLSKAKTLNVGQLNSFADTILPKIRTNISTSEIWGLIPKLASFKVTESIGWPYDTKGITLDRWYGVPVTLQSNVERLHKEAFEQEDYEASDTVKEMSAAIVKKTGYSK